MRIPILIVGLALSCLLAAPLVASAANVTDPDAPRSLPAGGPVSVDWTDPAQFSEIRLSGNKSEAVRGNWVEQLAQFLQTTAAKQLPQGNTLQVTFTDIQRAGQFLPGRGPNMQDMRVVSALYPPRINLSFKWLDAQGNVIDQGDRKLDGPSFMDALSVASGDALRYEKNMLREWVRREFKPRK